MSKESGKNTVNGLTINTIGSIHKALVNELTRRGFHTPITLAQEPMPGNESRNWLVLRSEIFNTTPVLFRAIQIASSGGGYGIAEHEKEGAVAVQIVVDAQWHDFNGGKNATTLFRFTCVVLPDDDLIYRVAMYS